MLMEAGGGLVLMEDGDDNTDGGTGTVMLMEARAQPF
jgi:hypothetical protein